MSNRNSTLINVDKFKAAAKIFRDCAISKFLNLSRVDANNIFSEIFGLDHYRQALARSQNDTLEITFDDSQFIINRVDLPYRGSDQRTIRILYAHALYSLHQVSDVVGTLSDENDPIVLRIETDSDPSISESIQIITYKPWLTSIYKPWDRSNTLRTLTRWLCADKLVDKISSFSLHEILCGCGASADLAFAFLNSGDKRIAIDIVSLEYLTDGFRERWYDEDVSDLVKFLESDCLHMMEERSFAKNINQVVAGAHHFSELVERLHFDRRLICETPQSGRPKVYEATDDELMNYARNADGFFFEIVETVDVFDECWECASSFDKDSDLSEVRHLIESGTPMLLCSRGSDPQFEEYTNQQEIDIAIDYLGHDLRSFQVLDIGEELKKLCTKGLDAYRKYRNHAVADAVQTYFEECLSL